MTRLAKQLDIVLADNRQNTAKTTVIGATIPADKSVRRKEHEKTK